MNLFCLIFGIACIAYYIACGLNVRFGQSILWIWPLIGAVCIGKYFVSRAVNAGKINIDIPRWFAVTFKTGLMIGIVIFLAVEAFVAYGGLAKCPDGMDYIVLLGCKTGSPAIEKRIDGAADYLKRNPDTLVIACGGQGSDEEMTEAEYMRRGLTARGIPDGRIILEDKSRDTRENISFSKAIIDNDEASIAIASSDFHIFRALHMAQKIYGHKVEGLSIRSSLLAIPHYMVREFFALIKDGFAGNMAF